MTASYGSFSVFKQDGIRQFYCRWSQKEDVLLVEAVKKYGPHKWSLISQHVPNRTPAQCSTRWHGALNSKVHKGRWSTDEDAILLEAVRSHLQEDSTTTSNLPWNNIAQHLSHRTGIQCQSRWTEALDPAVRKGRWHKEEDELLRQAVSQLGCCWIRVAGCIPSRTQRQCRTRWNQIKHTRRQSNKKNANTTTTTNNKTVLDQSSSSSSSLSSTSTSSSISSLSLLGPSSSPPSYSSSMSTLSLGSYPTTTTNQCRYNTNTPSSPSDSPPPSTPPTCIPAMIIPTCSDLPLSLSSTPQSTTYPTSIASITIPKDPFTFLLDHHMPSSILDNPNTTTLSTSTPSSSSSSSLNPILRELDPWFYDGPSH
ncbi:Homeodomain-like protein [Absidia repens]|uniref:Homeodomain-like protein n=1 Tax=Absidia repens TaxID=90262 RepID=A0A1X2IF98_9FUNG|nr:Homeodomain-like protein [Absidia repens]